MCKLIDSCIRFENYLILSIYLDKELLNGSDLWRTDTLICLF